MLNERSGLQYSSIKQSNNSTVKKLKQTKQDQPIY